MPRKLTPASTLENQKKDAQPRLKALRANDEEARTRLERVLPAGPVQPGLRHVQHTLAREYGLDGWSALKNRLAGDVETDVAHAERVTNFLSNACPDWRVGGPAAHSMA